MCRVKNTVKVGFERGIFMGNRNKAGFFVVGCVGIMLVVFCGMAAICIPGLLQHARTPIPWVATILCMVLTVVYIGRVSKKREMDRRMMFKIMVIATFVQFLIYLPIPSWSYPYDTGKDTLMKLMVAFMNQPTIYFIGRKMTSSESK